MEKSPDKSKGYFIALTPGSYETDTGRYMYDILAISFGERGVFAYECFEQKNLLEDSKFIETVYNNSRVVIDVRALDKCNADLVSLMSKSTIPHFVYISRESQKMFQEDQRIFSLCELVKLMTSKREI
jgi:hypothetical protein